MYCKNCGHELNDKAVICVHCGVATDNLSSSGYQSEEEKTSGGLLAVSFLFPIVGLILFAVFLASGRKKASTDCLILSILGILVGSVIIGLLYGSGL